MIRLHWPRTITIVRHGESEQNVALDLLQEDLSDILLRQRDIRDADISLTERGAWQAEQTGSYFAEQHPFDFCYSSPYRRTQETAQAILSQLSYDLPLRTDYRLREKEFGTLHGLRSKDVQHQFPGEHERRERDGRYWYRLPHGENYPDVGARVHSFLDKLSRSHAGRHILIVTHQVTYKMFRQLFEHLDESAMLALPPTPNCGIQLYHNDISRLPLKKDRMKLIHYDHTAYSPQDI